MVQKIDLIPLVLPGDMVRSSPICPICISKDGILEEIKK